MFARAAVAVIALAPFLARSKFPPEHLTTGNSAHPASISPTAAFAADCTRTYTVQEGDWCDTISAANNVST